MGIQFRQNQWHGLFYHVAHVDGIYILVVDDPEQIIDFIGRGIDNIESVTGKVIGVEYTYQYAGYQANCQ